MMGPMAIESVCSAEYPPRRRINSPRTYVQTMKHRNRTWGGWGRSEQLHSSTGLGTCVSGLQAGLASGGDLNLPFLGPQKYARLARHALPPISLSLSLCLPYSEWGYLLVGLTGGTGGRPRGRGKGRQTQNAAAGRRRGSEHGDTAMIGGDTESLQSSWEGLMAPRG